MYRDEDRKEYRKGRWERKTKYRKDKKQKWNKRRKEPEEGYGQDYSNDYEELEEVEDEF